MKTVIDKYGNPDAVIFSDDKESYNLIWGFDDILKISLEDDNRIDALSEFQDKINLWKEDTGDISAVGFFSYDAKHLFFPELKLKAVQSDIPLLWFGKPKISKKISRSEFHGFYSQQAKIVKKIDAFPKKILFSKKDKLKFEMVKFSLKKLR